jgi:hypothetical protein
LESHIIEPFSAKRLKAGGKFFSRNLDDSVRNRRNVSFVKGLPLRAGQVELLPNRYFRLPLGRKKSQGEKDLLGKEGDFQNCVLPIYLLPALW